MHTAYIPTFART